MILKAKAIELNSENEKLKEGLVQFSEDNYQNCIIKESVELLLKDNSAKLKNYYELKFSKAKKNHFELKEKHDVLLIKHCRLINRLKTLESD